MTETDVQEMTTAGARRRDPLRQVRYSLPTTILFGQGVLEELPALLEQIKVVNPLLITDKGLAATTVPAQVTAVLDKAGVTHAVFDEVQSDPSTHLVDQIAELVLKGGHDGVIGLGGGSAMDSAKAAAAAAANGVSSLKLVGQENVENAPLPIIAIPTTAGPGSEVTRFAVLTDEKAGAKVSIASMKIMPVFAILAPELTVGLPAKFTSGTGLDALGHAIESYGSVWNNPISEGMALQAITLIGQHLRTATNDPTNLQARGGMLAASCIAELAANTTRLGLAHALAVPLGATHHVPHGLAVGMMLIPMCAFNEQVDPERYARIASALEPGSTDIVAALTSLYEDIGMESRLAEFGVIPEDYDRVIDLAVKSDNVDANPREASRAQLAALLEAAL
ncbi:iron-containing alcohol dehydrogenase [Burkholderia sp. RS01]|uniref:iron-containing alcohol dehydrogenase family protein n=1 Tax=Bacteria TaxID=2 RepID=UPI0009E6BB76|nr:iron-containing alcohol dehydrogenase [Arthrobacter sp. Leaf337]